MRWKSRSADTEKLVILSVKANTGAGDTKKIGDCVQETKIRAYRQNEGSEGKKSVSGRRDSRPADTEKLVFLSGKENTGLADTKKVRECVQEAEIRVYRQNEGSEGKRNVLGRRDSGVMDIIECIWIK